MRQAPCLRCGTVVELASRGRPRIYCVDCRVVVRGEQNARSQAGYLKRIRGESRTCRDCQQPFTVGTQPNTCGRCHSLRMNPGGVERCPWGSGYQSVRTRLIDEAADCELCGGALTKDTSHTDPKYPNIDHIIQRSDGGGNAPENLRVVHRQCNDVWAKTVPKYRLAAARGATWLAQQGL
jgi:5-methylcytosine-specific restriction endonuclease McrA